MTRTRKPLPLPPPGGRSTQPLARPEGGFLQRNHEGKLKAQTL